MFSKLVKIKLVEKDMKKKQLADLLGCSIRNLDQNLRNDNFRISTMLQIAEALDCNLEIRLTDRV